MKIEILSIDYFKITPENDAEIALLDHWDNRNVFFRDISTDNEDEPKTLECLVRK